MDIALTAAVAGLTLLAGGVATWLILRLRVIRPQQARLRDLEDILVQVAQFDTSRGAEELDLITDGLQERQVLPRIRSAVPAGPARAL